MSEYTDIHDAPLDQLLRWWSGAALPPAGFEEEYFDEVAFALSKHRPDGVATLKRCLYSDDLDRRAAALSFLAYPDVADEEVRGALTRAFGDGPRDLKYSALWGFIHLKYFPLERRQVSGLLESENQRMAALAMVYLSWAYPSEAVRILRAALRSPNPRMREYACDEIGDRDISELSEQMRVLLGDPDEAVAQAAQSNMEFFNEETA